LSLKNTPQCMCICFA